MISREQDRVISMTSTKSTTKSFFAFSRFSSANWKLSRNMTRIPNRPMVSMGAKCNASLEDTECPSASFLNWKARLTNQRPWLSNSG